MTLPLNVKALAEMIYQGLIPNGPENCRKDVDSVDFIESLISEAMAEEIERQRLFCDERLKNAAMYVATTVRTATLEEAAEIAEVHRKECPEPDFHDNCGAVIATKLREKADGQTK